MFFDMHMDIWTNATWEYEKGNKDCVRKKFKDKFVKGNMGGGIFVIWLDDYDNPKVRFEKMLDVMCEELYYSRDFIKVVREVRDFRLAKEENKLAVVLGIEGLAGIGENIEKIYQLERFGVRHIGLTWNETNAIATGQSGDENRGLTQLGKEAVKLMEKLGIIIDLSHGNDKTFWDMVKCAKKPFLVSHSNVRSLCPSKRNLTDDQLMAIKETGGLVGVNAYKNFVSVDKEKQTLSELINHLEYMVEKIGIDKVGFGFDFADYYEREGSSGELENFRDARDLGNVVKELEKRGFLKEEINKLCYENFVNFMGKIRGK